MMVEEDSNFDKALEIDEKVWKIMARIQSKKLRELYRIHENGLRDLITALKTKFNLEGYRIGINFRGGDDVEVLIYGCPWLDIMKRSGREHLAARVGEKICRVEFKGWADSFDNRIRFSLDSQLCKSDGSCRLRFWLR